VILAAISNGIAIKSRDFPKISKAPEIPRRSPHPSYERWIPRLFVFYESFLRIGTRASRTLECVRSAPRVAEPSNVHSRRERNSPVDSHSRGVPHRPRSPEAGAKGGSGGGPRLPAGDRQVLSCVEMRMTGSICIK